MRVQRALKYADTSVMCFFYFKLHCFHKLICLRNKVTCNLGSVFNKNIITIRVYCVCVRALLHLFATSFGLFTVLYSRVAGKDNDRISAKV